MKRTRVSALFLRLCFRLCFARGERKTEGHSETDWWNLSKTDRHSQPNSFEISKRKLRVRDLITKIVSYCSVSNSYCWIRWSVELVWSPFVVVCNFAFVLLLFLLGLLWSALVFFGYWSCCLEVFLFRVLKEVWRSRRRRTRRREEVEKEEAGKWFAARGGLLAWQKLRGLAEWLRYSTMEM